MDYFSKLPNGDYIKTDPTVIFDMSVKEILVIILVIIVSIVLLVSAFLLFFVLPLSLL